MKSAFSQNTPAPSATTLTVNPTGTAANLKEEIIFDNKRYRVYNNWVSVDGGLAYHTGFKKMQRVFAVDYQFHIQKEYFQVGLLLSGHDFSDITHKQLHVAYGQRLLENEKYNIAWFGGLSYGGGYFKKSTDTAYTRYEQLGIGGNFQVIYKLKYDVGIGASVFVDCRQSFTIVGIRLDTFFSSAYRGIKKAYQ